MPVAFVLNMFCILESLNPIKADKLGGGTENLTRDLGVCVKISPKTLVGHDNFNAFYSKNLNFRRGAQNFVPILGGARIEQHAIIFSCSTPGP